MVWRAGDPQGNESAKIKHLALRWLRGRGLDLGCGPFKIIPTAIGVDNGHHWGHQQAQAPYVSTPTCEKLDMFGDGTMDYVFSSHLLEHIQNYHAALAEWWRVLKPGGYLILYLPHADLYPNIGKPGANPDHKHDYRPEDIIRRMVMLGKKSGWDLLINEVRDTDLGPGEFGNEYSFYQVWRKRKDGKQVRVDLEPVTKKRACVVRYGGYGDQIQASSILTELKKQGYEVTFLTTPKGYSVLREDPRIDEWFIQDEGVIPEAELDAFWQTWAKQYDKWINLSESIEGTLLPPVYRAAYRWPHEVRHKYFNRNYLEWTHELAQVPFNPDPHFFQTPEENLWAGEMIGAIKDKFIILWAQSGSSNHKAYPYQDNVMARIMLELPEAYIILTGDDFCRLLEQGWENEPRVSCQSGELTMRQVLTLAKHADLVIGPETGTLNAVSFEENHTICLLSHSSEINLTRDWKNTTTITPDRQIAPCHPCHLLHHGRGSCPIHEKTGAAICAAAIDPDGVFEAIKVQYERWRHNQAVPDTE